jgi:hypothetical protein
MEYSFTIFNLALDGGEWSASRPGRFTLGEIFIGTHCVESSVDPQSRSGRRGKEKILLPLQKIWICSQEL